MAEKRKLTKSLIESSTYKSKAFRIYDQRVNNLYIKILKTKKVFYYRYRINGKTNQIKIGDYPLTSLNEARQKSSEYYQLILKGTDPKSQKDNPSNTITINELIKEFRENYMCKLKPSTVSNYESNIKNHIIPYFNNKPIDQLTRGDISKMMVEHGKKSKRMANQVKSVISTMYKYALRFDYLDYNPTVNALHHDDYKRSRDRVYTHQEIKTILKNLDLTTQLVQDLIVTFFITGKRKTETFKMHVDQLDLKERRWTIPPENTKTNQRDVVYITNTLKQIIKRRISDEPTNPYIFPSRLPKSHYGEYQHIKELDYHRHQFREAIGIEDFIFHDIRTTIAVNLSELGISFDIIDLILGHKIKGHDILMNNYMGQNSGDYKFEEKKEALKVWERKLHQIIHS